MLFDLLSSNALRILTALLAGGALYLLARRAPLVISLIGLTTAALLAISFIFDIGEVYNYSDYYKRAFWYFGDDVTTWLGAIFVWAVLSRQVALSSVLAAGVLFSGTKISLGIVAVEIGALLLFNLVNRRQFAIDVGKAFGAAGAIYIILVVFSPVAIVIADRATSSLPKFAVFAASEDTSVFIRTDRGRSACVGLDCVYAQVQRPLEDRLYSSIGGLWMALEGDFAGAKYPNSNHRFADLMIGANPWGINDKFDITRDRWLTIGGVQTSYLQFGSGYGVGPMSLLLLAIAAVILVGLRNIMDGERGPFLGCTLFFMANALVNLTQPWLNPGPVLILMGFCATHILFWRLRHVHTRLRGARAADFSGSPSV